MDDLMLIRHLVKENDTREECPFAMLANEIVSLQQWVSEQVKGCIATWYSERLAAYEVHLVLSFFYCRAYSSLAIVLLK